MTIIVHKQNEVAILDLIGPLVLGQPVQTFRERVRELMNTGTKNFAVNLGEVPYIDSSGIGSLVGAYTSIEIAGAKIKFFAAPQKVMQILKSVRLHEVFDLFTDEASALSSS